MSDDLTKIMSDYQANVVACVALRNKLASLESRNKPEEKALIKMFDMAIMDGRPNAMALALGLLLANAVAWEAVMREKGTSSVRMYEQIRAETGGGGAA